MFEQRKNVYQFAVLLLSLFLIACEKSPPIEVPTAQILTREANGYYCLMTVVNHKGPKGQIILDDGKVLWFTSVRDTISFTLSAEEPKNISAIYVNDMADADWDKPGLDNWINAYTAWYVLGSDKAGGMGTPETVPFSTKQKADSFIKRYNGKIYKFDAIPKEYIVKT